MPYHNGQRISQERWRELHPYQKSHEPGAWMAQRLGVSRPEDLDEVEGQAGGQTPLTKGHDDTARLSAVADALGFDPGSDVTFEEPEGPVELHVRDDRPAEERNRTTEKQAREFSESKGMPEHKRTRPSQTREAMTARKRKSRAAAKAAKEHAASLAGSES